MIGTPPPPLVSLLRRTRPRHLRSAVVGFVLTTAAACATPPPAVVEPAPDPMQLALALEDRTALQEPLRIVFDWRLNESGSRISGRGVARIEPPYRARLDLFLGSGETAIRAALVDGEYRLPPGAPQDLLPPPELMWGVLGVFRAQYGVELMGAERLEGEALRLRYRYPDDSLVHYRIVEGRVRQVERLRGDHVVERVQVELVPESRYPLEATYRDLTAFRELHLTRASMERVESFPPDIWDPASIRGNR